MKNTVIQRRKRGFMALLLSACLAVQTVTVPAWAANNVYLDLVDDDSSTEVSINNKEAYPGDTINFGSISTATSFSDTSDVTYAISGYGVVIDDNTQDGKDETFKVYCSSSSCTIFPEKGDEKKIIKWKVSGTYVTYSGGTIHITLTPVLEKTAINPKPTLNIIGWTYGEYDSDSNGPAVTGLPDDYYDDNGAVTYQYKSNDDTDATYDSLDLATASAGNYTVKAIIAETDKYKGAELTADFTIAKAKGTFGFTKATEYVPLNYGEGVFDNPASVTVGDGTITSYGSSSEAVAMVDGDGKVTLLAQGSTNISATITDGTNYYYDPQTVSYKLYVEKPSAGLQYGEEVVEKKYGDSPFTAELTDYGDAKTLGKIVYSTEANNTVADVNASTGEVTIKGVGNVSITATVSSDYNGDYDYGEANSTSYSLDVIPGDGSISYEHTTVEKTFGDAAFTNPLVHIGDATTITYSSDNTSVATVDSNGEVTIIGAGTATITAAVDPKTATNYAYSSDSASASYTLSVGTAAMTVTASDASGVYDPDAALSITVNAPEGATIKYRTADSGEYDLTENPTFTNVGDHKVYYQVTKDNYTTVTGSATVSISPASATISFDDENIVNGELVIDYSDDLGFSEAVTNTGDGSVTYSSSDTSVAKIDADSGYIEVKNDSNGEFITITATVTDGDNYTYAVKEISFKLKINKGTFSGISVTPYEGNYDGEPHGITVVYTSGATIKFLNPETGDYDLSEEKSPKYTDAGNYTVSFKVTNTGYEDYSGSGTVTISPKPVKVTGIKANDKYFDGKTDATFDVSDVSITGELEGDVIGISSVVGAFEDAEVGTDKTVNITQIVLGGTSAGNYKVSDDSQKTAEADIIQASFNPASLTNLQKPTAKKGLIYNGKARTLIKAPSGTLPSGYHIEYSLDNGTNWLTNVSDVKGTNYGVYTVLYRYVGEDPDKYKTVEDNSFELSVGIGKATLYVKANDKTIAYGDDPANNGVTYTGFKGKDTAKNVTITGAPTYTYSYSKGDNVGTYTITPDVSGLSADNYTFALADSPTGTLTVSPREITVNWGTTSFVYNRSVQYPTATADNLLPGDSLTLTVTHEDAIDVGNSYTAKVEAFEKGNYKLSEDAETTYKITPKPVTVSGIEAADKMYDGDAEATLNYDNVAFAGMIEGDALTVTATGTFDNKNVGTDKTVTITALTLGGASAGNYKLAETGNQTSTTANITAKEVTISGYSAAPKIYNGKTSGKLSSGITPSTDGFIVGDNVQVSTDKVKVTFADANVGTDKTVTLNGFTLTGTDAGNYTLTGLPIVLTDGVITAKTVGLKWENTSFVYDGNEHVPTVTLSGVLSADTCTPTVTGAATNVGNYTAAVTELSNGNYALPAKTTKAFKITPAAVTVTAEDALKAYGDADPTFTVTVTGLKNGDKENVISCTISRTDGEDVGEYAITPTGDAVQGNYAVTYVSGTFTITEKNISGTDVTVSINPASYEYNGSQITPTENITVSKINGGVIDSSEYDVTYDNNTEVGTATATITTKEGSGYVFATGTDAATVDFEITKIPDSISFTDTSVTKSFTDSYTQTVTKEKNGDGNVTYSVESGEDVVSVNAETGELTFLSAGTATIKATVEDSAHYSYATKTATYSIEVTAVDIPTGDVTVTNYDEEYDAGAHGISVSVNGITGAVITYGTDADSCTASKSPTYTDVSTNTVYFEVTANGYNVFTGSGTVTITKKPVTVSGITAENKTYDGNDKATLNYDNVSFAGMIEGDALTVTATGTFDNKNVGTDKTVTISAPTLGGDSAGNYKLAETGNQTSTTADITAKEVTISGYSAAPKTYNGKTSGKLSNEGTPSIDGVVADDNVQVSTDKVKVTFDDANVGTGKTVTLEGFTLTGTDAGNYTLTGLPIVLTDGVITKRAITIKAYDQTITYGQSIATGTDQVSVISTTKLVSSHSINSVSLAPSTSAFTENGKITPSNAVIKDGETDVTGNYKIKYSAGVLKIGRAAVTVTAGDASKTYGDTDPTSFSAAVEGLIGDDSIAYSVSRETGEDAKTYKITPTGDAVQGNYAVTYVPGTFTITRAAATVKADAKSKIYGDADPTFTVTVTGLKNGDKENVISCTISRTDGEDVGEYTITPTGNAVQGNYDVSYDTGKFTITRAAATVTANDLSKYYNEPDPTLTVTITGLKNGDKENVISYIISRAEGSDVGEYEISTGGNAVQGNYDVAFEPGKFTIKPIPVTVTADSCSKTYGDADPTEFTATVTGLAEGDSIAYTVSRAEGENFGTYEIKPEGEAEQGYYSVSFISGTFTINRAEAVVTANNITKIINQADPPLTATVTGLKNGDATNVISYSINRVAGNDKGDYAIIVSGDTVQGNYNVVFQNGTFKIQALSEDTPQAPVVRPYPYIPHTPSVVIKTTNPDPSTEKPGDDKDTDDDDDDDDALPPDDDTDDSDGQDGADGADGADDVADDDDDENDDIIGYFLKIDYIVPTQEMRDRVAKAAATLGKQYMDGMFWDITLFRTVNGVITEQIHESSEPVTVSIEIPEAYRAIIAAYKDSFNIVRIHNGVIEIIECSYDERTGILTFISDKFSDYVLIYDGENIHGDDNPKTYAAFTGAWIYTLISGAAAVAFRRRKKEDRPE